MGNSHEMPVPAAGAPQPHSLAARPAPAANDAAPTTLTLARPSLATPPGDNYPSGPSLARRPSPVVAPTQPPFPASVDTPQFSLAPAQVPSLAAPRIKLQPGVSENIYTDPGPANPANVAQPKLAYNLSLAPPPEPPDPHAWENATLAWRSANDSAWVAQGIAQDNQRAKVRYQPGDPQFDPREDALMNAVSEPLTDRNAVRASLAANMPRPGRKDNTLSSYDLASATRQIRERNLTPQQKAELADLLTDIIGHTAGVEDMAGVSRKLAHVGLTLNLFNASNRGLNKIAGMLGMDSLSDAIMGLRHPQSGLLRHAWGLDEAGMRERLRREFNFTDADIKRMVESGIDYKDYEVYLEGWIKGLKEFYDEIKDKL